MQVIVFLVVEIIAAAAFCAAIAVFCWPAAIMVAAFLTVLAIERQPEKPVKGDREPIQRAGE